MKQTQARTEYISKRAYEIIRNRLQALESELFEYGMKFDDKDFMRAANFIANMRGDRTSMIQVIDESEGK